LAETLISLCFGIKKLYLVCRFQPIKAKFHYAICLEAGSKLVGDQLRTS